MDFTVVNMGNKFGAIFIVLLATFLSFHINFSTLSDGVIRVRLKKRKLDQIIRVGRQIDTREGLCGASRKSRHYGNMGDFEADIIALKNYMNAQ